MHRGSYTGEVMTSGRPKWRYEALSGKLAEGLRSAGHDVVPLRHIGRQAAPDSEVLPERAIEEERVMVSTDMEFGYLLAARDSPGRP